MISQKLISQVQSCADKLTNDLVYALQTNPRCQSYRTLPPDRLIELKDDLYKNLGRWLSSRSKAAVEARYLRLGRERYVAGIPLSEVIFAQSVTKSMLLHFIRGCMCGDAEDLKLEHELVLAVSEFFDEVIYWVAMGYEDARRAQLASLPDVDAPAWEPRRKMAPVSVGVQETADVDLDVSRAGDVGEASG